MDQQVRMNQPATEKCDRPSAESCSTRAELRAHAAELQEQLSARLQQLDRREAQLNARAADLDNALRIAQLRISERETEVLSQQKALEQSAAALRAAVAEFEAKHAEQWDQLSAERERLVDETRQAALQLEHQIRGFKPDIPRRVRRAA